MDVDGGFCRGRAAAAAGLGFRSFGDEGLTGRTIGYGVIDGHDRAVIDGSIVANVQFA